MYNYCHRNTGIRQNINNEYNNVSIKCNVYPQNVQQTVHKNIYK